ncbi:histidine kinase [Propylenella binzhouense]|uniref:Histidine kinase n=1 Tax=Propylenella binzhouense TaxID=2555902 RepID=A0A964WVQ7_9HYPH|nr:histidine kinase [Propylenella binzhouense]MYZ50075.1 histidine kinase [Propylenella binzhouense]
MPTLFRFLFVIAVIAALVYGTMLALVFFVEPTPHEMTERIPANRLDR